MDDLIPISRQDGGVGIGNTGYWMVEIYSPLAKGHASGRARKSRVIESSQKHEVPWGQPIGKQITKKIWIRYI